MGRGSCMGYSLWHHSLLIRIITEGKNNALGYLLHWLDWGETRKHLALQCRTQWSALKFCGCDLNLKTFNNMQQVPWFLFSANRNYILFLNLLICQPHRHVSFWTTVVLTASQWLQSILIIVKTAHKEGFPRLFELWRKFSRNSVGCLTIMVVAVR